MNLSLLVTALIMSISNAKDLPISGSSLRAAQEDYRATSNLKGSGYDSELLAEDRHGLHDLTSEDYGDLNTSEDYGDLNTSEDYGDLNTSEDYGDLTSESEDWTPDKLPFLLAGGSVNKCDCDSDKHCRSGFYCAKSNCSPDPVHSTSKRCECNHDKECGAGKYCKELNCNFGNGLVYGRCAEKTKKYSGFCVKDHRNEPRACKHKQCNHKENSSKCQCSHHETCVKNSNACYKTGDLKDVVYLILRPWLESMSRNLESKRRALKMNSECKFNV